MNVKYLALLAAIGFVTPVEATPFIIVADIRFFLASSVPSDNPMVREYVPSGETLENWEQLVAAEWNLWRASYVDGKGLVVYQYARRIYTVGPEFGAIVKAAREKMYNAFAAATFVELEDAKQ